MNYSESKNEGVSPPAEGLRFLARIIARDWALRQVREPDPICPIEELPIEHDQSLKL